MKIIRNEEIIRYVIVGVVTTAVSVAVYYICVEAALNPQNPFQLQIANVVSWTLAVIFSYFANRRYVFKSTNPRFFHEFIAFLFSRWGTLLLDMGIMFVLVTAMGVNDKISKLISQGVVIITNYLVAKLFVFTNSKE